MNKSIIAKLEALGFLLFLMGMMMLGCITDQFLETTWLMEWIR